VAKNTVAFARRDIPGRAGKSFVPQDGLVESVRDTLIEIQDSILSKATTFRDSHFHDVADFERFKEVTANGWAYAWWCGDTECETRIKAETMASNRCMPLDQPDEVGTCIQCGKPAHEKAYFARAY
jgi:prolyl-tRNA synthetase